MDDATWAALAASMTVLAAIWTVVAWRRRGVANGLRALAVTLLPAAAWLTGTLEMFTEIVGSVLDWGSGLVLDPSVWTGIGLAGSSALLLLLSGVLRDRQLARGRARGRVGTTPVAASFGPGRSSHDPAGSNGGEQDEIEEILRRRGIS